LCLGESRIYGGIGVYLENPKISLVAKANNEVVCEDWNVEKYARKITEILEVEGIEIEILETIPAHMGLGSGTQLALAIYAAICEEYDIKPMYREHAPQLGRGKRSGIGVASFEVGGFNMDRGQETGTVAIGEGKGWKVPNREISLKIPKEWVFVVSELEVERGYSGKKEKEIINFVMENAKSNITRKIETIVHKNLIPSIQEKKSADFGFAVGEISRLNGNWYEKYQGGIYRPPIGKIVKRLQEYDNIFGVGQSSWGPTLYSVTNEEHATEVERTIRELLEELEIRGTVIRSTVKNSGADIRKDILE
tara:strand:+ start:13855 stop:14778 length:924 start_codon:yes stop_codon:yes gene_type:complete